MGSILPVSQIIQVNVTKQQAIKSLEDFGLLCVFTDNPALTPGEVKLYPDVTSFDADFITNDSMKNYGDIFFAQNPVPTELLVARLDTGEDYPTAIERVKEQYSFYAVGLDDNALSEAVMQAIATKVEDLELLMIVSRGATDVVSVANTLQAMDLQRTALIAVDDSSVDANRPDAAWFGVGLTRQAGAFNWANNNLGSTPPTASSVSTIENWLQNSINVYAQIGTTELTLEGTTLALNPTYLDQIQAMDWIKINLQQDLLDLLLSQDKVPYTDPGVKICESVIQKRLIDAQNLGILDPTFRVKVSAPSITTLSPSERATRTTPVITAEARLAGAINKIVINVNVEI